MATRKTAIAIPEELLKAVDSIAAERGESRSRFIGRLLKEAVAARRDAEITQRINSLFADPLVREEQKKTALQMDESGSDWSDETW